MNSYLNSYLPRLFENILAWFKQFVDISWLNVITFEMLKRFIFLSNFPNKNYFSKNAINFLDSWRIFLIRFHISRITWCHSSKAPSIFNNLFNMKHPDQSKSITHFPLENLIILNLQIFFFLLFQKKNLKIIKKLEYFIEVFYRGRKFENWLFLVRQQSEEQAWYLPYALSSFCIYTSVVKEH